MADKLEDIFEKQRAFNESIKESRNLQGITRDEWLQKQTIAMLSEMAEVLNEINFKWWKNEKQVNEDALKEELIDVLHFFISMCLTAGMDAQELYQRYLTKNAVNFDRQQGMTDKEGYKLR